MKKYFIFLVLASVVALSGCDAYDENLCYQAVVAKYPGSDVILIPGEDYRFIVKSPNGDVYYVETMSTKSPEVTQEFLVVRGG